MPEIELIPWFERRAKEEGLTLERKEGLQRGVEQGLRDGTYAALLEVLRAKFGRAPRSLTSKLKGLDADTLRHLHRQALFVDSLASFEQELQDLVS